MGRKGMKFISLHPYASIFRLLLSAIPCRFRSVRIRRIWDCVPCRHSVRGVSASGGRWVQSLRAGISSGIFRWRAVSCSFWDQADAVAYAEHMGVYRHGCLVEHHALNDICRFFRPTPGSFTSSSSVSGTLPGSLSPASEPCLPDASPCCWGSLRF